MKTKAIGHSYAGPMPSETAVKRSAWSQARRLADQTPPTRNRCVDLLRAVSIMAVVLGHWIMAAPFYDQGQPWMWHLLAVVSWSQWLTWIFQVMPVFFFGTAPPWCW